MKKKIVVLILVLLVLVVVGLRRDRGESVEEVIEFSVHDLNWEDIEGMNARASRAFYSNPPYVYDASLIPIGHLEGLLEFFRDNADLIRDEGERDDFDFTLHFTSIVGEEVFLGNLPSELWERTGDFELRFYFDRSLEMEFLDVLNAANRSYLRTQNPGAFDEHITLLEVDWEELREDYGLYVSSLHLIRGEMDWEIFREKEDFWFGIFLPEYDDLSVILTFLEENQTSLSGVETEEFIYSGSLHFERTSENEPREIVVFFMTEAQNQALMEAMGEEAWGIALSRQQRELEDRILYFNPEYRVPLEEIDWAYLHDNHADYVDHIGVLTSSVIDIPLGETMIEAGFRGEDPRFVHALEWLSGDPVIYAEDPGYGFAVHIRFWRSEDGLEDEKYADRVAWFFVSYDDWDAMFGAW